MSRFVSSVTHLAGLTVLSSACVASPAEPPSRPNFVVVLVDDMGFSDVGCYGGEIETPNLDRLARDGLRYTQMYNTARCWPTRASLLTGYYAQQVRRDRLEGIESGGTGRRPAWARLLPERLAARGYRSYHAGKWHVDGMPIETGFDRSYYVEDQGRFFSPRALHLDDRRQPAVDPDTGYYATTAIVDHAVGQLADHAREHADRPFFQYVALTAPHFPLHARPEDIARYAGRYVDGWGAVRRARWTRLVEEGVLDCALSAVEPAVGPPYAFPDALEALGEDEVDRPIPWSELTDSQRAFQAVKMEIHAAMVDCIDREVGRLIAQLEEMGALDDTVVVFLSDNGASAEIMVRDDGHDSAAAPGSAATHLCLGPGWSSALNAPFRRHKTWVHEGGIATPFIVHWPAGLTARGELRRDPGHVIDIAPTLLGLAGATALGSGDAEPPSPGRNLAPSFARDVDRPRAPLWWFHDGHRAIRDGDLKAVSAKGEPWQLYDLAADRSETRDLAASRPDDLRALVEAWERMRDEMREVATRDL